MPTTATTHLALEFVVLHAIAAMARERPQIFRPFLNDFFVVANDAAYCRALKLEVLTALVNKDSAEAVLRELQTCVSRFIFPSSASCVLFAS